MEGYIYKCTCCVNDKIYIGQTIQGLERRRADHWKDSNNPNSEGYNFKFHNALRKYGKDKFKWEVIETVISNSLDDLRKKLNDLEIRYVSEFDSYLNGYNSTIGGDYSCIVAKSLASYTDDGTLIKSFTNVSEAADYYKIPKGVVWQNCSRCTLYTVVDGVRICFRWDDNPFNDTDLKKLKQIHYDSPVLMYDLNGNLLNTFKTIKEASDTLNIKRSRITTNCRKITSFVLIDGKRYIFRYPGDCVTESDINTGKNIKSDPKKAVIAIDSVTNKVIGEFKTISDARRALGVNGSNISEVINGHRKTAGKYNGNTIKWVAK